MVPSESPCPQPAKQDQTWRSAADQLLANADDSTAFENFESWIGPRLRSLAAALVGREFADDIAQEVLFGLHRALKVSDRFTGPEALCAWCFRCARNAALNWLRSAQRKHTDKQPVEDWDPSAAAEERPDRLFSRKEDAARAQLVLAGLPSSLRVPLVLYYWCNLTVSEIACELGIEVGTVKSRLSKARQHFRERWIGLEGEWLSRPGA